MAGIQDGKKYPWDDDVTKTTDTKDKKYPWDTEGEDKGVGAKTYPWDDMEAPQPISEPQEKSSLLRRGLGDPAISLAKGVAIGLPQAVIGIADIPTMGYIGKSIDYITQKALGGTFSDAGEWFDEQLSPETQEARRKVSETDGGFFAQVGTALENPSSIVSTVAESLPQMYGAAGIGRMALKGIGKGVLGKKALAEAKEGLSTEAAKALAFQNTRRAITAGAVGEGAISAGQNVAQVRQQMIDGTITPLQAILLTGSGMVTGLISRMSGGLANRLGIADFDNMMQGVWAGANKAGGTGVWTAMKAVVKGLAESAIVEGVFEELPQEAQETMASNIALGRPTMDGVAEAAAMGMLAGALMGFVAGGTNVARNLKNDPLQQDIENQLREADPEGATSTPQSAEEKAKAIAAVERIIAAEGASRETPINLPESNIIPAPKELPLPAGMGEGFTFKDTPQDIIKRPPYTVGEVNPNLGVEYKPIMASNGKPFKTEATASAALKSKKLTGKYVVTAVDGGFALTRKTATETKAAEALVEAEKGAEEQGNKDEHPTKISPLTIERAAQDAAYRVEEVKREDGTTEYRLINDELGFNKWLAPEQAVELFNLRKAPQQEAVSEEKVEPQVAAPQPQVKEEAKTEAPKKLSPEELQKQADDLEQQYEAAFDDYNDALETGKPPEERAKIKQRLDALEIESQKAIEAAQEAVEETPKPKKIKTAAEAKQKIAEKKIKKTKAVEAKPVEETKEKATAAVPEEGKKNVITPFKKTKNFSFNGEYEFTVNGETWKAFKNADVGGIGEWYAAKKRADFPKGSAWYTKAELIAAIESGEFQRREAAKAGVKPVAPKEAPIAKTKKKVSEQKEVVKEKPVEKTKEKVAAKKAAEQSEAPAEKIKKKITAKKEAQQPSAVEQKSQQEAAATPAGKPKTFQEFLVSKGLIYNEEVRKAQYPSKKLEELNKKKLKELGKTVAQLSEEWKSTQGPVTKFAIGREGAQKAPGIIEQIYKLAKTNPAGFTIDISTGGMVEDGIAVAPTKRTEVVLDEMTVQAVNGYLEENKDIFDSDDRAFFGGWQNDDKDSKNYGKFVLDVSFVLDNLEDAIYVAEIGGQDGIFNIRPKEYTTTKDGVADLKARGVYEEGKRAELGRIQEKLHRIIDGRGANQRKTQYSIGREARGNKQINGRSRTGQAWRIPEPRLGIHGQKEAKVKALLKKDPSIGTLPEFKNRTAVLTHWSISPNLTFTDPSYHGTGYAGAELEAKRAFPELWMPKTYTGYGAYVREEGLGNHRYAMEIPGNKLYNIEEDALGLFPTTEEVGKYGYSTIRAFGLIYEMRIRQAGFTGFISPYYDAIGLFEQQEVKKVRNGQNSLPQAAQEEARFSEGRAEAIGNIVRGRSLYDALKKEGPYVNHSIIVNPDGSVTATKGKSSVTIEMVKEIKVTEPKDLKGFEEEYNKPYEGQKIFGAYYKTKDGSRAIKFIEQDGVWTLWHETTHLLKETGLMTPQDEAAVAAIYKRMRPGQKFDEHKMSNFIAGQMEQRNWDRNTAFGRFMQKLADFIDSLANLVYRTGRGVIRDMESGKIWEKGEKPVDLTEEAQFSSGRDYVDRNLVIVHNISQKGLRHALKMGGLAAPSVAVIDTAKSSFDSFGDITLIASKEKLGPAKGQKFFNADVYSPRYPSITYVMDSAAKNKLNEILKPYRTEGEREIYDISKVDDLTAFGAFTKYVLEKTGKEDFFELSHHEIDSVATGLLDSVGAKERIFGGFTPQGTRRYLNHNLDTVVRLLKKELRGGEGFNYGTPSIRAKSAVQFRTVKKIQESRDKIVSEDDMAALKHETDSEFNELADQALPYLKYGVGEFGALERFTEHIIEAVENRNFNKVFGDNSEYYNLGVDIKGIVEFVNKLRNMPTEYFEGKIQRKTTLNEFDRAIVPNDAPQELIDGLKENGIIVDTYVKGRTGSREAAIAAASKQGALRFSTGRPGEPTNPPNTKDPRTLERHLRDDSAALYKTILNKLHPKNMTTTEMLLNSPEFWQHPELAKIVNLFSRDKSEIYHMAFNDLNAVEDPNTEESAISETAKKLRWKGIGLMDRLRGKVSKEYQMLSDFLTQADSDPDMVQTLKAFDYDGRLKYFEDYMKKHGATPDVIRVWKLYRDSYDKALDMRTQELKDLIDQMTEEAVAQGEDLNIKELRTTLKYALAEMEGWKGLYAPRVRSKGEWVVQMYKEHGPLEEDREWFRDHRTTEFGAQRLAKDMEALGWKVWNIGDIEKLPESVYQDTKMISTSKLIDSALKKLEATEGNMVLQFRKELLQQVADEMRARGFRSHMIKRREGYGAVQGFLTDAMERHLVYISNLASGIAKARVARQATETLNGRMENGKQVGGIDPQKSKKEWRVATDYIKEQLRNQEKIDRMIGIAKSITTFKYLGFNLRALGVNMTALATTAPANIHQQALGGKGSMTDVLRALGGGMKDYISFMRGQKLQNPLDQKFLEEQHKKGHDDPTFMREAMGTVDKFHNKVWGKMMDASMWLFGKTEQFNRGATMLAAFRLGYKKAVSEGLSQDAAYTKAAEGAIMSSNRAHGIYGKSTDPYMALGNNPSAKMFQMLYVYMKFPHTYIQSMYDMGFRKKNIKGALWAMLSPMVVAGAAVFPFKDVIFGFASAILKALDDDRDPEKFVWDVIREHMGDTGEIAIRHGLTGLAGIDISGSLAVGVGLPKNVLDLTGAIGGVYQDIADFGEHLGRGEAGKAAEKLLPTGIASPFRASREATEGVTTKRGFRVWTDKDRPYYPTAKATATRALGFRGTEQAILAERTWEGKRQQQNINKSRAEIYAKFRHWALGKRDKDEYEDIRQDIKDFNSFIIKNNIRGEALISSTTLKAQLRRITKPTKKERATL